MFYSVHKYTTSSSNIPQRMHQSPTWWLKEFLLELLTRVGEGLIAGAGMTQNMHHLAHPCSCIGMFGILCTAYQHLSVS